MEAQAVSAKSDQVEVTLGVTNEDDGTSETVELEIAAGPTKVPDLKVELNVANASALWVVEKNGKKKALGPHESWPVKAGDHFEALVKGGIS